MYVRRRSKKAVYWTFSPAEIGVGLDTTLFYLAQNKFKTIIRTENNPLYEQNKKHLRNFVSYILENDAVLDCKLSYSYIILYKDTLRFDFFVENATNIQDGMIHYYAKNSTLNFYLIDENKEINHEELAKFYNKTCQQFDFDF